MPSTCSFFANDWFTPAIMLRTCAAYVPHSARAKRFFCAGVIVIELSLMETETAGWSTRLSVPPFPFTISSFETIDTSVPAGIDMGSFPILDISFKHETLNSKQAQNPKLEARRGCAAICDF